LKKNNGQAMVELALVLPVLVLILVGIIEFGMIFKNFLVVNYGASEIARMASLGASDIEINNLEADIFDTLNIENITVSILPLPNIANKGEPITVEVNYSHELITPIISNILQGNIVLTGESIMIKE
jgi:Flp pilus assembly protein TadG